MGPCERKLATMWAARMAAACRCRFWRPSSDQSLRSAFSATRNQSCFRPILLLRSIQSGCGVMNTVHT